MIEETPVITDALRDFLVWTRLDTDGEAFSNACEVVDHLSACLNSYGPDGLSEPELARFTADGGGAGFCSQYGAGRIVANLPFFLDYYMVRNVVTAEAVLAATGTVIAGLATWLADNGFAEPELARVVRRQATAAAIALPQAERMARLLSELAATPERDPAPETTEGFLTVTRVDDEAIWFDTVGPVEVGREAAALARPGWIVSIVLAHIGGRWSLYDVGNVYPRSDPGEA